MRCDICRKDTHVIQLAMKSHLYDIFFKVKVVVERGWNKEVVGGLGKRIAIDMGSQTNNSQKANDLRNGKRLKCQKGTSETNEDGGLSDKDVDMKRNLGLRRQQKPGGEHNSEFRNSHSYRESRFHWGYTSKYD